MKKKRKRYTLGTNKHVKKSISITLIRQLEHIQKEVRKKEKAKVPFVWISDNVEVRFRKK